MVNPKKLVDARVRKGLTQEEAADRARKLGAKITRPQISRLETPTIAVDPQLSTLEFLCRVYGCELADITSPGAPEDRAAVEMEGEGELPVPKRGRRKVEADPVLAVDARDQT